ncbi:DUF5989 family protein [Thermodesulfobacteriota bacterium]
MPIGARVWDFMKVRKKWWFGAIVVLLAIVSVFVVVLLAASAPEWMGLIGTAQPSAATQTENSPQRH